MHVFFSFTQFPNVDPQWSGHPRDQTLEKAYCQLAGFVSRGKCTKTTELNTNLVHVKLGIALHKKGGYVWLTATLHLF